MKKESNIVLKLIFCALCLVFFLPNGLAFAKNSYASLLKKWTRHDTVFVWDNLEVRTQWHATYLSPEMREFVRKKKQELLGWTPEEVRAAEESDQKDDRRFDTFFVSIYAGSSAFPEIGKDSGQWRLVLEKLTSKEPIRVSPLKFEHIHITQVERLLYPYLDKWSEAYLLIFPKTLQEGDGFSLRMTGIPVKSELVWRGK